MGKDTTISELFVRYDQARIDGLVAYRDGETKLGEKVAVAPADQNIREALTSTAARFVLVGIPEDIGVRANGGVGGAHTVWEPALKALLNLQSTTLLTGESLLVLGAFNFDDWMNGTLGSETSVLRNFVAWIDDAVYPLIEMIVAAGKIPIVIGGGHNNALPLLKGTSKALNKPVNCMNLDAHSDYRMMEGRHSGNGFRYAKLEGYLRKYAMIGLHKNYNAQTIIDELTANPDLHFSYYDAILMEEHPAFRTAVFEAITHTVDAPTGIELDVDCIAGVLASAATPSGISVANARQYVQWCAQNATPAYLHLTEGATELRDGRKDIGTAKLIAYLVSDFLRIAIY